MASVEENMSALMNYVSDKQDQKTEQYKKLFTVSLQLMNQAFLVDSVPDMEIAWNKLDGLSSKTRSEIFRNFAEGINKIISVAGMTKDQLYKFWKLNFPQITEEEIDKFNTGLRDMAGHVVITKSSPEELMITNGENI